MSSLRPRLIFSFALLACAVLNAQPDATEEILKQAIGLHQAGDIAGAIRNYEKYVALRPNSVLALSNLGAAYAHESRYQDAIVQYRRALKLQPANPPIELNLALAFYKTGQIENAAGLLDQVHREAPAELQPVLLLADCRLSLGENKKVIDLLSPLVEKRPDDLAIAYLLGTALVRDDQPKRGQPIIDRIMRQGDSAETRMLLGTAKLNAGDFPAALVDLTKAVEMNPNLPGVYSFYGQALLRTGNPADATEAYRKALAANPYDFSANLQMAVLLREDEKLDEAAECLKRAQQVRPNDIGLRFQLAAVALHDGKLESARRDLESIVKDAPKYTEAHVSLATVYYRLKRKEDGDRERAIVQKLNAEAQAKQQQGLNVK